jgi:hypothetical protein
VAIYYRESFPSSLTDSELDFPLNIKLLGKSRRNIVEIFQS